jgi:hypothetical protein
VVAIPFVRVYSVPDVSWEQIEGYFDRVDLPERPDPAKLKALLQYVKEKEEIPPEYRQYHDGQWYGSFVMPGTYEEYVLLSYAQDRRYYNRSLANSLAEYLEARNNNRNTDLSYVWQHAPWERARADRMMRLYIIAALFQSGGLQEERAKSQAFLYERLRQFGGAGLFLSYPRDVHDGFVNNRCRNRLDDVAKAMDSWYEEHGTLPNSLNDLVGTYLEALPVHPFTQAPVEYHRNSTVRRNDVWQVHYNTYVFTLGPEEVDEPSAEMGMSSGASKSTKLQHSRDAYTKLTQTGGTYMRLGDVIYVIAEPSSLPPPE